MLNEIEIPVQTTTEKPLPKKRKTKAERDIDRANRGELPMTKEEAFEKVRGQIYKLANKYKNFCNEFVTFEDLLSAAYTGCAYAYRDWDPNKGAFITLATPRIERAIDLYLIDVNPRYKNNVDAKTWLRNKNDESFETLLKRKVTKDADFNKEFELDGVKPFTKELYNRYAQKVANRLFNNNQDFVIKRFYGTNTKSGEGDSFDLSEQLIDENEREAFEMYEKLESVSGPLKSIAELLVEGYTISEISKKLGMSKKKIEDLCLKYSKELQK